MFCQKCFIKIMVRGQTQTAGQHVSLLSSPPPRSLPPPPPPKKNDFFYLYLAIISKTQNPRHDPTSFVPKICSFQVRATTDKPLHLLCICQMYVDSITIRSSRNEPALLPRGGPRGRMEEIEPTMHDISTYFITTIYNESHPQHVSSKMAR